MNRLTDAEINGILAGVVDGVHPTTHETALALEAKQWREAAKKPVAWGLFDVSNGELYSQCLSLDAAEQYRNQIHQSDSVTLEIKPIYAAPPTITVTLPELQQTSCSESEKYYWPADVIEAIQAACAAAGIQCVIEE